MMKRNTKSRKPPLNGKTRDNIPSGQPRNTSGVLTNNNRIVEETQPQISTNERERNISVIAQRFLADSGAALASIPQSTCSYLTIL